MWPLKQKYRFRAPRETAPAEIIFRFLKKCVYSINMITISELYYYPVKSCKGIALKEAEIGRRGILDDREFMLVNESGLFISQRNYPRMALIQSDWRGERLILSAPGMDPIEHTPFTGGEAITVKVWHDRCRAIDQGDEIAAWLADYLGQTVRLVRFPEDEIRKVDPAFCKFDEDQTSFTDGFPFLLISESSLRDLNQRMAVALPVDRFRPNIVVSGSVPYAEDTWAGFTAGNVEFSVVKPCARCVITTVNQENGIAGDEPLNTLSKYRRSSDGKVLFGQNLIHHRNGMIRVGDRLTITGHN